MSLAVPIFFNGWRSEFAAFFSSIFRNDAASCVSVSDGAIQFIITLGALYTKL